MCFIRFCWQINAINEIKWQLYFKKKVNNDKSIPKIIEFIRPLYTFSIGFFVCSSKKLFFNQIDTHSNVLYDFKMKRREKKTRNTITWNAESVKMLKDFTKKREKAPELPTYVVHFLPNIEFNTYEQKMIEISTVTVKWVAQFTCTCISYTYISMAETMRMYFPDGIHWKKDTAKSPFEIQC